MCFAKITVFSFDLANAVVYIGHLSGAVAYGKLAHAVIYFKIGAADAVYAQIPGLQDVLFAVGQYPIRIEETLLPVLLAPGQ